MDPANTKSIIAYPQLILFTRYEIVSREKGGKKHAQLCSSILEKFKEKKKADNEDNLKSLELLQRIIERFIHSNESFGNGACFSPKLPEKMKSSIDNLASGE